MNNHTTHVKFNGVEIHLGGEAVIIPPLTLGQIQRFESVITTIDPNAISAQNMAGIIKLIHAALSRNYPNMSVAHVADLIDLGNLSEVIAAVMGISGLKKTTPPSVN